MSMLLVSFILFLVFLFMGVPIAFSLGCGSILAILFNGSVSPMLVAQKLFSGVNSFSLMAIPFFMLSGELMEAGGISERLIEIAKSFLGHITGGIGMVDIGTSALFAGVSGSAAADTAAVGSMLIPSMLKDGYVLLGTTELTPGKAGPSDPRERQLSSAASLLGVRSSLGSRAGRDVCPPCN